MTPQEISSKKSSTDDSNDPSKARTPEKSHPPGLSAVSNQVLRYFREFIETDFKRQQAPRRRIQLKTSAGFRSGIDLRKYPALFKDVWDLMSKPAQDMSLSIRRRKYRAQMSPVLKNLVSQYALQIDETHLAGIRSDMVSHLVSRRIEFASNPDGFVEEAKSVLAEKTASVVVQPLLVMLENTFKENAYSAQESIFEVQSELTDLLCDPVGPHLDAALNTVLLSGATPALQAVLEEFFCASALRPSVVDFFEAYAAADVLQELRDLQDFMRSDDGLTIYLYLGALRCGANDYPLFFLPVQVKALAALNAPISDPAQAAQAGQAGQANPGGQGGYELIVEPRLYVNKQAIEYVTAQIHSPGVKAAKSADESTPSDSAGTSKAGFTSIVNDRIIHLTQPGDNKNDTKDVAGQVKRVMGEVERSLDIAGRIDFSNPTAQTARSNDLRLSNAVHLAVFDRNDESLVNDYEALLSSIDTDHQAAHGLFTDFVSSMLFDEPQSVSEDVRKEWDALSASSRLVLPCAIALNEEQARIDVARRKGTRFIAVEGPPGTGKSHAIAALSFNAIMDGLSVLIVSDKNEALEVVQDKLTHALQSVRHGDDFPNPILRLGKDGTYRTLISASSRVKIENHHRAQSANMSHLESELASHTNDLSARMEATIKSLSSTKMADIAKFHGVESTLRQRYAQGLFFESSEIPADHQAMMMDAYISALQTVGSSPRGQTVIDAFESLTDQQQARLSTDFQDEKSIDDLLAAMQVSAVSQLVSSEITSDDIQAMGYFTGLPTGQKKTLVGFVKQIEELKLPVIGYLFKGRALASIEEKMSKSLPCPNPTGLAKQTDLLRKVVSVLDKIERHADSLDMQSQLTGRVYNALLKIDKKTENHRAAFSLINQFIDLIKISLKTVDASAIDTVEAFNRFRRVSNAPLLSHVFTSMAFIALYARLKHAFEAVPRVDFVKEKAQLEAMHTARLAHRLDSRFLEFVEKHRATAQALGGVIKARSQFPVEQFKTLSHAFPCVIAGIRELAEFVPLKTEVFDLCIIDEGSQVSVAQAMPAMLRAKQVIVFGDRKQFSNVKSHNASNATNAGYLSELQGNFRRDVSTAVDKLERLQRFDVKRSVLEFIELVAGHTEMLRKHFRGYPELISYSSQNFYDGTLQAIKIRAKPIEDVLRFEIVGEYPLSNNLQTIDNEAQGTRGTQGAHEMRRNINVLEAARLMGILEELLEGPSKNKFSKFSKFSNIPSVGVITPFTEQAAYISTLISRHPQSERMDRELRLKVMTADSCQGEERDIIIYSMVATRQRDVLNFVFPVELKTNDDENDTLKAQRLNVAFSRAKEMMIFILSKPPEEFVGTLGRALMHYQQILNNRTVATDDQVDKASPMERKVLHWLKNTRLMQQHGRHLELVAQFPVGQYLRQLDPTYKHPAYKVDFLLRHHGSQKVSNIIIEYDGFEHHFTDREKVTAANHEHYQKPQDVERQFILESYGYRFLRINRFNMGRDPVATLDDRLSQILSAQDLAQGEGGEGREGGQSGQSASPLAFATASHDAQPNPKDPGTSLSVSEVSTVQRIMDQAQALDTKEARACGRCKEVKEKADFFDPLLANCQGAYGRVCRACKANKFKR